MTSVTIGMNDHLDLDKILLMLKKINILCRKYQNKIKSFGHEKMLRLYTTWNTTVIAYTCSTKVHKVSFLDQHLKCLHLTIYCIAPHLVKCLNE